VASGGPWEDVVGYSRAVVLPAAAQRVLVSGSTATVGGVVRHPGDAYRQAHTVWDVVEAALREAGAGLADVVRTRMYVVGREHCDAVGRAHSERVGPARPAATMVLVAGLVDPAMLVEVEVEALVPGAPGRGTGGAGHAPGGPGA
jgi:enamine deaminase RidA (YjgF/YER057c/UK114 family)